MNCAYCKYTDGVVYCSLPPKYKCTITGEYHLALDDCNVDFAPVVRCKDCKFWNSDDGQCPMQITGDPYYDTIPNADWFCADGERRTKGDA